MLNSLFLGFGKLFASFCCQFGINHDSTAVFANDNFLVCADIDLALWRDAVEAATASITVYHNDAQSVAGILADTLECCKGAFVHKRFEALCTSDEAFLFVASLANDVLEIVLLFVENVGLVLNFLLGGFDIFHTVVYRAFDFADSLFAEFDFEGFVFNFLGEVVEFVVVAHVEELLVITLDEELLVFDFVLLVGALCFEVLDLCLIAFDTCVKPLDGVFKILNFAWKFSADVADAVDFAQKGLKFEEGFEALFYRAGASVFLSVAILYYRYCTGFCSFSE